MTPFNLSEFRRLAEKRSKRWEAHVTHWEEGGKSGTGPCVLFTDEEGDEDIDKNEEQAECDMNFIAYCGTHADAIIERIEKLEKVAEVLKAWCQDDPRDSYSEKLHDALEALERGE